MNSNIPQILSPKPIPPRPPKSGGKTVIFLWFCGKRSIDIKVLISALSTIVRVTLSTIVRGTTITNGITGSNVQTSIVRGITISRGGDGIVFFLVNFNEDKAIPILNGITVSSGNDTFITENLLTNLLGILPKLLDMTWIEIGTRGQGSNERGDQFGDNLTRTYFDGDGLSDLVIVVDKEIFFTNNTSGEFEFFTDKKKLISDLEEIDEKIDYFYNGSKNTIH